MGEKKAWVQKVIDVFMGDLPEAPSDPQDVQLQDKIMSIVMWRLNGLDHRRCGLLAADVYRLVNAVRRRVIEDVAKVAAKATTDTAEVK